MGESVFVHMTGELLKDSFKDHGARKVPKEDYELFLKEAVFDKLKGKKLGQAFTERFGINDRVLSNYSGDQTAIEHIKYCEYVE